MVNVVVNGKSKSGNILKDVVSGEIYKDGANIAIIKGIKKEIEKESESKKYKITTTKGSMVIGITENNETVKFWNKHYKEFEGKNLRWKGISDMAFGSITIDLNLSKESERFKKWDVVLSVSGFDKSEGHLVFVRKNTTEIYGIKNPKIGILIGGKRILSELTPEDKILSIEPIRESREKIDYMTTTDLTIKIEEGWKIWTYCEAELDGPSKTVEHVLALTENGYFESTEITNTYIADCRLQTIQIDDKENLEDRDRGYITVRNIGNGVGKAYIYKERRASSPSHTVVGKIKKGMELVDFSDGGIITITTKPERLNAIGKTVSEARELFNKYNIKCEIEGNTNDDDIIIEQSPEYTLDVLKSGEVKIRGKPSNEILYIEIFDDKALVTSWYFRKTTGLTTKRIGTLKTYFKPAEDMVMFERNEKYAKGLLPENTPSGHLDGGYIGVTNMVKRYKGYIGIRLSPNDKYGPTGETFEGTNIVGKVVKNADIIKKLKMGDVVYILEVNKK